MLTLKGRGDWVYVIESKHDSRATKREPVEELKEIQLDDNLEYMTRVGTTISLELKS